MIHGNVRPLQEPEWRRTLREAVTDPADLLRRLGLPEHLAEGAPTGFPLRVPAPFLGRMQPGDPADPLLRQVLPIAAEGLAVPGYGSDPVGDLEAARGPGLLQKYRGRALAVTTGSCAIHCRFCFRRDYPYASASNCSPARLAAALDELDGIEELILSGGDPLSLGNGRLGELCDLAAARAQITTVRLHTRLPVVIPARVDAGLLDLITRLPKRVVIVLHANHAHEIDTAVETAVRRLRDAGATLLNQAVLLAGVNDSVEALAGLGRALFAAGVLPYYLHQLDRVRGAAHFAVSDRRARALHRDLAACVPGYLLPRLVRERPGAAGKAPL